MYFRVGYVLFYIPLSIAREGDTSYKERRRKREGKPRKRERKIQGEKIEYIRASQILRSDFFSYPVQASVQNPSVRRLNLCRNSTSALCLKDFTFQI